MQESILKSATKPLKVLIAFTRPLITEFIIRKTKCSEKIKRSALLRKTKCTLLGFPPPRKKCLKNLLF